MASRKGGVPVTLKLIDEKGFVHKGRMDFVNNAIDTSTGTIRARALFDNPNGVFTPGMFGRVRVPASTPYTALLVPDAAIGSDQTRKYVLTVNDKDVAQQKHVTLGQLVGKLRVIKSGLSPNDEVVVNGIARVRPNQKVKPQQQSGRHADRQGDAGRAGQGGLSRPLCASRISSSTVRSSLPSSRS